MKKTMWWGVLLVLLFVVGCGSKTVVEEESDEQETVISEERGETEETAVEEIEDYTLSVAEEALLAEHFGPAERAELSTPFVKDLHVGNVYVAALGLRNILGSVSHDFVVEIKFREAKDFSGSIIPTDDALVQAWLGKNIFVPYALGRSEVLVLPVIIEIGNKLSEDGDPVVPGTYIYDVYIGYITNAGNTDEYQNLLLTVQVKE